MSTMLSLRFEARVLVLVLHAWLTVIAINWYVVNKLYLFISKVLQRYLLPDLSTSTTGGSVSGGRISAVNM